MPLDCLLTEPSSLEIKEVDLKRIRLQVVDTVLVFMAISSGDAHDRCVQILSRSLTLLSHRLSLLNEILSVLHLS